MAASDGPHKGMTHSSIALTSATGLVRHVFAAKSKDIHLQGKSSPNSPTRCCRA
ncbi:hypothetical protein [Nocardia amamiensis]|uniref:hypothetical protein n=1 Tax=Nocardia amamiensis TaxID=404578 RepID=UPI000ACBB660|nr:hypothetical protein [Nocardia amamiensis]